MTAAEALERGRRSYDDQSWGDAYRYLTRADEQEPLGPGDLVRRATAAYLLGRDETWLALLERAHHDHERRGDAEAAVRCAFWIGLGLLQRGEVARGGGWLALGERLLADAPADSLERAYLTLPGALQAMAGGDPARAHDAFAQAAALGRRGGDVDLTALGLLGQGQALVKMGRGEAGIAVLDEVMVTVTTRPVLPIVTGIAYCAVILSCQDTLDLRRAQEWTAVLSAWCEAQPDLVPYRGQCLVHRSELLQLHGDWSDAVAEADRACARLSDPPGQPAAGMAHYQQGELHRLRGQLGPAAEAYRRASEHGRDPQPGLALLRLAEGSVEAAAATIRRVVASTEQRGPRSRVLAALVEIALAAGDRPAARQGAEELTALAAEGEVLVLVAMAAQARGSVLLAEGDPGPALGELRAAQRAWGELDAPYEVARLQVAMGRACQALGDGDAASWELAAARATFERLGAAGDLASLDTPPPRPARPASVLTDRELEVLTLVAAGRTNREIAGELFLSPHTVRRHLQNTFAKLGASSRAEATALALQRGLLP